MRSLYLLLLASGLFALASLTMAPSGGGYGGSTLPTDSAGLLSSNQVVQRTPEIDFYPTGNIRIWDGTNSFITNFPSSTTFGFNEVQNMFPWRTNGATYTGGLIRFAAGDYYFESQIFVTNNFTIKGAGHLSTVLIYDGMTNFSTLSQVTNAFGTMSHANLQQVSLFICPSNSPTPIGEFITPSPNLRIEGITIKPKTNFPCVLFYSAANRLIVDDLGLGGAEFLVASNGAWKVGYLDKFDLTNPPSVIGAVIQGDGSHLIENSDIGGLADSLFVDTSGWVILFNNTFHVAGQFIRGNTNCYPTNGAASFLGEGVHVYNQQSYNLTIHDCFFDEANYDLDGSLPSVSLGNLEQEVSTKNLLDAIGEQKIKLLPNGADVLVGYVAGLNQFPTTTSGVGDLAVEYAIMSDFQFGTTPSFYTDGSGNAHAVSYTGSGSGLNNSSVAPTALSAGANIVNVIDLPTNALGTHGYKGYFTNGLFVSTGIY